MLEITGYLKLD